METLTWYRRLFSKHGSVANLCIYLKYQKENNNSTHKGYILLLDTLISLKKGRNVRNRNKCLKIAEVLQEIVRFNNKFEWYLLLNLIDDLNGRKCDKYTFTVADLCKCYKRNNAVGRTLFFSNVVCILVSFSGDHNIHVFDKVTSKFYDLKSEKRITIIF